MEKEKLTIERIYSMDDEELNYLLKTDFDNVIYLLIQDDSIDYLLDIRLESIVFTHKSSHIENMSLLEFLLKYYKVNTIKMVKDTYINDENFFLQSLNGRKIIDYMLDILDEDLIKAILNSQNLMSNILIVLILNKHGIDAKFNPVFEEYTKNELSEYEMKLYYEKILDDKLNPEEEGKIKYLKELFLKDNKSDKEVVELACNAFKHLFIIGYIYAMDDLNSLINIKLSNPNFSIRYIKRRKVKKKNSHFNFQENCIYISNRYDIYTFNHELAHAFHFYYNKGKTPEDFNKYLNISFHRNLAVKYFKKFRKDIDLLKLEFNKKHLRFLLEKVLRNNVGNVNNLEEKFYINAKESLKKLLEEEKDLDNKAYLVDNILDKDNFINAYYNSLDSELFNTYIILKMAPFASFLDMIDAISMGWSVSFGFLDENHTKITNPSGHGEKYYFIKEQRFTEIFAQYISILKSNDSEKILGLIKNFFGEEFTDYLDLFYKKTRVKERSITK